MAYQPTVWTDHVVERPKTYNETINLDGSKTFVDAPGEIIQQGTPMSATNFNNLEEGVGSANSLLDLLYTYIMQKIGHSEHTLESLDAAKLEANANAVSASKLALARAIGITGKATGAGVDFDGSAAINIIVTALDPTGLSASVAIGKGGTGGTDAITARDNLSVPSKADLLALTILTNAMQSVNQMTQRAQESRITTLEAQVAALT